MYDEKELKDFDYWKIERPKHEEHGTPEEIRKNLQRLKAVSWHMEGNKLVAKTEDGSEFGQTISTDYICNGTDSEGLPILTKVVMR